MTADRTKEEVVALILGLNFAPTIQATATALTITATDGSGAQTIRRAPPTQTKVSNAGTR